MSRCTRSKIKLQTAKLQTCCGEGERVFTVLGGWISSVLAVVIVVNNGSDCDYKASLLLSFC